MIICRTVNLLGLHTGQHMVSMLISITPLLHSSTGSHDSKGVLGGEHVTRPLVHRHCSQSSVVHVSL